MKGMHNNAAAMGLLESMTAKNEHRIREIYNMGYNQGYRDGLKESVQGCDGCIYDTPIPQKQCLRCKRYWRDSWRDSYERKDGDTP